MSFLIFFLGGFISAILSLIFLTLPISFENEKIEIYFLAGIEEISKFLMLLLIAKILLLTTKIFSLFSRGLFFSIGFSLFESLILFLSDKSINYLFFLTLIIHFISALLLINAALIIKNKNNRLIALGLLILAIIIHAQYNLFAIKFI